MIELKPLDKEYAAELAHRHHNTDKEQLRETLKKHLLFGYDVWYKGTRQGVVLANYYKGQYILDGYNEHQNRDTFFAATIAGRKAVQRLFAQYSKTVYTCHPKEYKAATLLAKRIGFKKIIPSYGKYVIFKMEDNHGT